MSQVKGINPGRLNRRITIMRYQAIEDELGNQVQQLVPLKSCWRSFPDMEMMKKRMKR